MKNNFCTDFSLAELYKKNNYNYFVFDFIIIENCTKLYKQSTNPVLELNYVKFGNLILTKRYYCAENYVNHVKYC